MKKLVPVISFLLCVWSGFAQTTPSPGAAPIEKVATTADLAKYTGESQVLMVTGSDDGGMFYYSKDKHTVDNGVIYPAAAKGCYWIRIYDKTGGVDIAWFAPKMDSATDDWDAMKKALAYPYIKITGNIALSNKITIPEGKTLEFAQGGAITTTDSLPLKINAFIKATDYQYIFKGNGKVLLGTNVAPYVSACWFGAASNCLGLKSGTGTDNTIPIQNAINAAQKVSDLYLPPAPGNTSYRITSTINITKRLHFFTFRFHGSGTTITLNGDDKATIIFADFSAGSAINVEGSRRVYLSDFALRGINKEIRKVASWDTLAVGPGVNNPSNFLSPGVKLNYAGITTDADKDSKVWSADIVFERLQIDNFSIGIGISQGGHYQGDRMRVENTQIVECVYGISIGQAQNRACHFLNVDMNRVWCGITNNSFGDHTGSVFQVTGGQWCHVYRCFWMQPSYLGQCVVSGLFTEAIGCIGVIGDNNPNNSSMLFTGCEFYMQDFGIHGDLSFRPSLYTLWAYGNVTFEGCNFWTARHYLDMFAGSVGQTVGKYTGSTITLKGCSVLNCKSIHIKGNSMIENTYLIPVSGEIDYNRSITADFEGNNRYNTGYSPEIAISGMENNPGSGATMSGTRQIIRKIPRFYAVEEGKENISDISLKHDTLQFTYTDALDKSFFRYAREGDYIGTTFKGFSVLTWDNPTMIIENIDAKRKTVTARALTTEFTFDKIALYTNSFFTTQPVTGIVKSGSEMVTDVANCEQLRGGDFITFAGSQRAYRISEINKKDNSLTLLDAITEPLNGRLDIVNEVLADNSGNQKTMTSTGIRTVSGTQELTSSDNTVIVNDLKGDITITLPKNVPAGHIYTIKKITAGHMVTIAASSGTIDGKNNYTLKDEYQGLQVQYDGENYIILSK